MESQIGTIVLVGFMGAGKTSGVRSLAAQLDCQPLDSDHELERSLGESIESFFDREGEHAFRAREEEAVLELLGREDGAVIALGGGCGCRWRLARRRDRLRRLHGRGQDERCPLGCRGAELRAARLRPRV